MFNLFKAAPKQYEDLDGKTFKTRYENAPKAKLLDVRTVAEFASGTLPTASNLDVTSPQFVKSLAALDKNTEYFVFCRSGNRSGSACDLMTAHGFKVYNLAGGIGTWPE
ncbi:rhodanese-like domain-containing protein [Pontibacter sp. Tf4]|uniref:rhodanese-like domain-containing protein n=1 Tax=Pontibacter sp. Tf4 TaxID=2761620 RepID=UPI0016291BC8|nr:rhodanese-like domain-containing protein [Pontibacter sp. Tf4]MBB6610591.1 rhodanese-like domain-containing protein [Pontibacter sp. Tf4]